MTMTGTLDAEERDILVRFERGELVARSDAEREMSVAREAASNTFNKTRRVSPGVTERDDSRGPEVSRRARR